MSRRYVSNRNETVRMFESDFLESMSHINPIVIPIVWVPVTVLVSYAALGPLGLAPLTFVALFAFGIFLWTFAEYTLHRFVFHYQPDTQWGKRLHFILHGVHHDYPNDATRLVMPLSVSVPLALLFYGLFHLIFGGQAAPAVLAGFIFGYIAYDMIHYATHHLPMRNPIGRWLKKHHMRHHYGADGYGYGVSSPLWDYVFGTIKDGDSAAVDPNAESVRH